MNGMVSVHAHDQDIAERSRGLQIPYMPNMQQIKTSIRSDNLLPARSKLFATTGKLVELHYFCAHLFTEFGIVRQSRLAFN